MYPFPSPSVRDALSRLALCLGIILCLAWFSPCPATAQTASGQFPAASDNGRDAGSGLSVPDGESAGDAPSPWEHLFAGSYLGALLFGYPAHGPGLPDLLLGCAAGIFFLRSLRSRRPSPDGGGKKPRVSPKDLRGDYRHHQDSPPDLPGQDREEEKRNAGGGGWSRHLDTTSEQDRREMQKRARAVWDTLRSGQPETPASPGAEGRAGESRPASVPRPSSDSVARGVAVPADFEVEEFLDGARMLYSRLQTSWAARDLEDLAPFATPEMLDILRRQAEQDPTPGNVDVLLVTAVLTGIIRREEEERVTVAFSAILQENSTDRNQDEKISVNEIWHFVRSPATGGGWRLDGIEQAP